MTFLRSNSDSSILVPRHASASDAELKSDKFNFEVSGSFSFSDVLSPISVPSENADVVVDDRFLSHWVCYDLLTDAQFQSEVVSDPLFQELAVLHQENNPDLPQIDSPLSEENFLNSIVEFLKSPSSAGEQSRTRTVEQFSDHEMRSFAMICERFRSRTPRYSDSSPKHSVYRYDRSVSPGTDQMSVAEDGGWVRRLPSLPEESSAGERPPPNPYEQGMKDPYEQGMKEPAKLPQPIRLTSDSLSDVFSSQGSPAPNFAQYIARLQNSEYLPSIQEQLGEELAKKDPPMSPSEQQLDIWQLFVQDPELLQDSSLFKDFMMESTPRPNHSERVTPHKVIHTSSSNSTPHIHTSSSSVNRSPLFTRLHTGINRLYSRTTDKRSEYSSDSVFERGRNFNLHPLSTAPSSVGCNTSSLPSTPSHSMYKPLHPPPQRPIEPKPTGNSTKSSPNTEKPSASLDTRVAGLSIKKLRSKLEKRKKKS